MPLPSSPAVDEHHPAYKHADDFCRRHFGNGLRDLGWEQHLLQAIADGQESTSVCEQLAEDDGLDYVDGGWGHQKPGLRNERYRG